MVPNRYGEANWALLRSHSRFSALFAFRSSREVKAMYRQQKEVELRKARSRIKAEIKAKAKAKAEAAAGAEAEAATMTSTSTEQAPPAEPVTNASVTAAALMAVEEAARSAWNNVLSEEEDEEEKCGEGQQYNKNKASEVPLVGTWEVVGGVRGDMKAKEGEPSSAERRPTKRIREEAESTVLSKRSASWTAETRRLLITAVQEHGVGNWAAQLADPRFSALACFGRSSVLATEWRAMKHRIARSKARAQMRPRAKGNTVPTKVPSGPKATPGRSHVLPTLPGAEFGRPRHTLPGQLNSSKLTGETGQSSHEHTRRTADDGGQGGRGEG
ncbi:unnamed protein product, partial [Discosporangium mesarthrocarpum]